MLGFVVSYGKWRRVLRHDTGLSRCVVWDVSEAIWLRWVFGAVLTYPTLDNDQASSELLDCYALVIAVLTSLRECHVILRQRFRTVFTIFVKEYFFYNNDDTSRNRDTLYVCTYTGCPNNFVNLTRKIYAQR